MSPEARAAAAKLVADHDIPLAHLLAIIEVESAGRISSTIKGHQYPMILPEPHLLYRMTEGEVRDRLVAEGLASAKWNKKLYPPTQQQRWDNVARAAEIAGGIAYEPVSYGVGQVLGQHWQALGFDSLQGFIDRVCAGVEGQIDVMLRYIERNDLMDELREGRWPAFFRGYNGPQWKKNGYGKAVKAALARFGGATAEPDGMLRLGSKGARVRELQALLVRAGYQVKEDGDFGPSTKKALRAFQQAKGLTVNGVYGPETEKLLGEHRQSADDKPGHQKPTEIKEVIEGGGAIGGGVIVETIQTKVDEATGALQAIDGFQPWLGYGLGLLSLVALGCAIYGGYHAFMGWWRSRRTVET